VLGNGIDLKQFRPVLFSEEKRAEYRGDLGIPAQALVVGMCGRFVAEKGFPEFLEAGKTLLEKYPELHLLVVGHKLESERAGAAYTPDPADLPNDRVHVLYDRDDMPQLYACMDVHCLPSHREGFPRVLIEGAASGLPQVATRIRGCRQSIEDGKTGFLVEVKNINRLTGRIDELLSDSALREKMGRAARALAELEFDQQRVFKRVAACYRELIKRIITKSS